jgi:hypothetical protein
MLDWHIAPIYNRGLFQISLVAAFRAEREVTHDEFRRCLRPTDPPQNRPA